MGRITAGRLAWAAVAGAACNDHATAPAGPSYSASGLAAASAAPGGARQGFGVNGTVSGFPPGAGFPPGGGGVDGTTAPNRWPPHPTASVACGVPGCAPVTRGP